MSDRNHGSDIVCPFCPLHCDDLRVDVKGNINVQCEIADSRFTGAAGTNAARIGPRPVSLTEAEQQAREILAQQERPTVVSSGPSPLSIARCLSKLQRDHRISLSVEIDPVQAAVRTAISRDGTIAATLGDVQKHSDFIWILGDLKQKSPRIIERLGCPDDRVVYSETVACKDLAEVSFAIRREQPTEHSLAARIKSSSYVTLLLGPNAFEEREATVCAELLLNIVSYLNQPSKQVALRAVMADLDSVIGLRSVTAWQSNQSLQVSNAEAVIRIGDSLVGTKRAEIQIGGLDPGDDLAGVYLPSAIAGIHFCDTVIRGDGTVTLPLVKWAETTLPTQADWLKRLLDHDVQNSA